MIPLASPISALHPREMTIKAVKGLRTSCLSPVFTNPGLLEIKRDGVLIRWCGTLWRFFSWNECRRRKIGKVKKKKKKKKERKKKKKKKKGKKKEKCSKNGREIISRRYVKILGNLVILRRKEANFDSRFNSSSSSPSFSSRMNSPRIF